MNAEYRWRATPTSRTALGLGLFTAILALAALAFVAAFGHDAPWADEWEFVPALLGEEPLGPWLWAQHNEHRLPLPRAVYWLLFRATHDFRAGMALQVFWLTLLSVRLTAYARRERGRAAWSDAFFPALLLHWGHAENFLMGYQLCFALVTVLTCELFLAVRSGHERRVLPLACLLALCGGAGLVALPFLCAWRLAVAGWPERLAWALPVAYLGCYFVGYARPAHHPPPADPLLAVLIALQVLSMGLGYAVRAVWPLAALGVVALGVATLGHLGRQPVRWGPLAVVVSGAAVAGAVGVGRSGFGNFEMGLWSRYGLLTAPLLAMAYLIFADRPRVQRLLAAVVLGLVPFNLAAGVGWGLMLDRTLSPVTADARAGLPAAQIVEPHLEGSGQEERALRGLPMLAARGLGPYRK